MKELEVLKPTIRSMFEHLHTHPEVSWKEFETTKYIAQILQKEGIVYERFDDCTGLVAEMGQGESAVALRTDIDALWQEVDGQFTANHSCGHDAHMTMALGAMLVLKALGAEKHGKIKFIFQPAEEKGTGALKLVEKGVVDDVSFLYGVHLRPIQELADGYSSPAIYHGAGKFIDGEIIGEDAHGARPHLGHSAIEVGAAIVQEINRMKLDPMVPYSAKMTKFISGGESGNIIPGKASFSLDLRAQTNQTMEVLTSKVESIFNYMSHLHEVKVDWEITANVAAAEVDLKAVDYMAEAISETLGIDKLQEPIITTGGEDFHFYTLKKPDIKATMLGLGCGLSPGLHHPNMTFNHKAIYSGIEILVKTIMKTLAKEGA
ncbi:M20 peptidase aminoacylase family protein [Cytobacillus purgationiresistens]|uniref:Amidohydrolase n=1 Tax=Cytobacillus purgationiresistens TaxID=863449 RepID=A0ABU0AAT8_9BACI|nr:M20 peptidase aminoacylase family protein [Cytobacillus purgationiresistens]MDQ0268364.1 amidohydrolase [Cytobacillus purgationiresistens]